MAKESFPIRRRHNGTEIPPIAPSPPTPIIPVTRGDVSGVLDSELRFLFYCCNICIPTSVSDELQDDSATPAKALGKESQIEAVTRIGKFQNFVPISREHLRPDVSNLEELDATEVKVSSRLD